MAYEKTDWQEGDLITEERLDKMEQGIADAQNATTIPTGALVPGAGIALDRDEDTQALTASVTAATASALGGVKQAAAVADLATGAALADVVAKVNELLAAQRAAGQVAAQ